MFFRGGKIRVPWWFPYIALAVATVVAEAAGWLPRLTEAYR